MKTSLFTIASVFALLLSPNAFAGDGWIDATVKANVPRPAPALRDIEQFATAYAHMAGNLRMRYNAIPNFDCRYEEGEYRFYFIDPSDGQEKYVRWDDVMTDKFELHQ